MNARRGTRSPVLAYSRRQPTEVAEPTQNICHFLSFEIVYKRDGRSRSAQFELVRTFIATYNIQRGKKQNIVSYRR